jgi:RNA-binding protein NOB1
VVEFARKTGDYEVLSAADLQVLALTYELECELNHGDWRLHREPGSVCFRRVACVMVEREEGNGSREESYCDYCCRQRR